MTEISLVDQPALLEWASSDGSHYVVRVWDTDTNGDGSVEGRIGEHGEVEGDIARVRILSRLGQDLYEVDAFVAGDPAGRWLMFVERGAEPVLVLVDTVLGRRSELVGADLSEDAGNPCMKPRVGAFDVSGRWAGWMLKDGRYRVMDVYSGASTTLAAPGRLWRAEPTPFGWAAMSVVGKDEGFPREKTTCACSWCPRFARSVGRYGWEGQSARWLVSGAGAEELKGVWLPVGSNTVLDTASNEVRVSGLILEPPTGCQVVGTVFGAPSLMMRCGTKTELFFPDSERQIELPDVVSQDGVGRGYTGEGSVRSFVTIRRGGQTSMAVLNWNTGALTEGPTYTRLGFDNDGWLAMQSGADTAFFSIDGSVWKVPGQMDERLFGLSNPDFTTVWPKQKLSAQVPRPTAVYGSCAVYVQTDRPSPITLRCWTPKGTPKNGTLKSL